MARKDLDLIKKRLDEADDHLRSAEEVTRRVKDRRGEEKIEELRRQVKRVKEEEFEKNM